MKCIHRISIVVAGKMMQDFLKDLFI